MFKGLLPKEFNFFDLFDKQAGFAVDAATCFKELAAIGHVDEKALEKMRDIEHGGDNVAHDIFNRLNKTFITPFDREDIHRLAKNIDEVVDLINRIAQDISLYKPKELLQSCVEQAEIIHLCAIEIGDAMIYIGELKEFNHIMTACTKISELESQADEINHKAVSSLFKKEKDPIELIKLKDILISLERAIDRAERVADILKVVMVKMV